VRRKGSRSFDVLTMCGVQKIIAASACTNILSRALF